MLTEKEGVDAIIKLQAMVGITEPEEKARHNWRNMVTWEKQATEDAYNLCFGNSNG